MPTTTETSDTSSSSSSSSSAAVEPLKDELADPLKSAPSTLRGRLTSERSAIKGATSFSDIADVIDGSLSPKKGESSIKLRNTDKGVDRARTFFDSNTMVAEKKAFVEDRYDGALSDQKAGLAEVSKSGGAISQILGKSDTEVEEANYDGLQWGANFGPHSSATLKQELVSPDDMQATVEVAQARGGLAKLVPLSGLWRSMDDGLQKLWTTAHGDQKAAQKAWTSQSKAAQSPAIRPTQLGPTDIDDWAPYGSLAAAFSKPTNGCMGMGEDYRFNSIKSACDALGLTEASYSDGAFVLSIPGGEVSAAVDAAKAAGGGVGKATVFTSLMFSEFNYIAEDRATNETESGDAEVNANAKQNSGKKSAGGKTEVVVTQFPAAAMFSQNPTFLG